jgi:hypothetical protein
VIFNCDHVTALVEEWVSYADSDVLDLILNESTSLVEVIVSRYPREHREDLIQVCLIRIPFAVKHFNPEIANLHTYLTSVFINRCNTYVEKENREIRLSAMLSKWDEPMVYEFRVSDDAIREELVIRNRERFPNIPVDVLDGATDYIYSCMLDGVYGKSRGAISNLMQEYGFKRNVATVIYHSSLIYMRRKYEGFAAYEHDDELAEFSLLPDLREVVGDEAYNRISIIFSGLYFKVP